MNVKIEKQRQRYKERRGLLVTNMFWIFLNTSCLLVMFLEIGLGTTDHSNPPNKQRLTDGTRRYECHAREKRGSRPLLCAHSEPSNKLDINICCRGPLVNHIMRKVREEGGRIICLWNSGKAIQECNWNDVETLRQLNSLMFCPFIQLQRSCEMKWRSSPVTLTWKIFKRSLLRLNPSLKTKVVIEEPALF